jgi:hypothetical protein
MATNVVSFAGILCRTTRGVENDDTFQWIPLPFLLLELWVSPPMELKVIVSLNSS